MNCYSPEEKLDHFYHELGQGNFFQCQNLMNEMAEKQRLTTHANKIFSNAVNKAQNYLSLCLSIEAYLPTNSEEHSLNEAPSIDYNSLQTQLTSIRKVVAITYHGRSGSYLLCSVFDGHPNILSVDFATNTLFNYFSDKGPTNNLQGETSKLAIGRILGEIRTLLPAGLYNMFFNSFRSMLWTILSLPNGNPDKGQVFRIIFLAWHHAHGFKIPANPIIVYSKHSSFEEEFMNMAGYFDTVYILQSTRQPDQTIASHIRHHVVESPVLPFSTIVGRMMFLYDDCLQLFEVSPNIKHYIVRFEDMHDNIEHLSYSMCRLLNIPFSQQMTTSTCNHEPYIHERKDAKNIDEKSFKGFGHKKIHKSQPNWMNATDKIRLHCLFADAVEQFGYPTTWFTQVPILRLLIFLLLLPLPMRAEITAYSHGNKNENTAEPLSAFLKAGYRLRIELFKRLYKRIRSSSPLPPVCK